MTGIDGVSPVWTAAILALAVGLGTTRLWLRNRSARVDPRAAPGRLTLLLLLQVLAGVLLFLTLHPPVAASRDATLVVATRGAGSPAVSGGEILVALPEAGVVPGAERVPDLATALRRHPQAARLRIIGQGLPQRDRPAVTLPLKIAPAPPIPGILEAALPAPVAPGATFTVGGRVGALPSGTVELVDPAGAVIARAPVAAGRRFTLKGAARAGGTAVFDVRLRDPAGRLVERLDVPVHARAEPTFRVVMLAGAPGPEVNFLRRWAEDADVDLQVGIDLGAGVRLGQAPPRLSTADLAKTDLLIVDDRSWERLDTGARNLIAQAVEGGMGLLLRPTTALAAGALREWAVLGAPNTGDGAARPLTLPNMEDVPDLEQWTIAQPSAEAVSEVPGPDGAPLATWRARGQGRIGLWMIRDSYVLALAGRPDAHADLWSDIISALGRAVPAGRPRLGSLARVGERTSVCGVKPGDEARTAAGLLVRFQIDHGAGAEHCAAYWPSQTGWTFVGAPGGPQTPIYVHPTDAAPSLRARESASPLQSRSAEPRVDPQDRWAPSLGLLFAILLCLWSGLWFLERRRSAQSRGIGTHSNPGAGPRASDDS